MNRRALLLGGSAVAAGAGVWWLSRGRGGIPGSKPCSEIERLTRSDIDAAVELCGRYIAAAQRPAGDFVYEVDWTSGKESRGNNVVRQAGAVWGLALWHCEGSADATAPLDKALSFWRGNRREEAGKSWLSYEGDVRGQMGTIALIGLALADRLTDPRGLAEETRKDWQSWLDEILSYAKGARLEGGGFADSYNATTGLFGNNSNPYVDGELLLLFSKVGVQLARPDCVELARQWAPVDHERNVESALAKAPDSDTTKGYYQWGSMSWHTLAAAGHDPERLGVWLIDLAHWMIDVHSTLTRTKNTAYAYEGILSAFDWAKRTGQTEAADKFSCVAHQGLRKLFSWQLGHPLARRSLADPPEAYRGGVQNTSSDPILRIDVTKHQLHAAALARTYTLA